MDEIAYRVWQTKYRYQEDGHLRDETIEDTWRRVARAVAAVEPRDREWWQDKFFEILKGYKFCSYPHYFAAGLRASRRG